MTKAAREFTKKTLKSRVPKTILQKYETDIMEMFDAGLKYPEIWEFLTTSEDKEKMPKHINSLIHFHKPRLEKRKKLVANNPQTKIKVNQERTAVQQTTSEPVNQDQLVDHNDNLEDYEDFMQLAKERLKLQN